MVLLTLLASAASAQEPGRGAEIRAAFVYNFAKFVEWPAGSLAAPATSLRLCAFPGDNKATRLDMIDGREAQGHSISVQWISSAKQASACQLLYLTEEDVRRHPQLLPDLLRQPVLTVGENETFLDQGGMVALFVEQDHVRFSINQTRARASGLKISARLLQLARKVE